MNLFEMQFKNVFICSFKFKSIIDQLPKASIPEWLRDIQILSCSHVKEDVGFHFDEDGERHTVGIALVENRLPPPDKTEPEGDWL